MAKVVLQKEDSLSFFEKENSAVKKPKCTQNFFMIKNLHKYYENPKIMNFFQHSSSLRQHPLKPKKRNSKASWAKRHSKKLFEISIQKFKERKKLGQRRGGQGEKLAALRKSLQNRFYQKRKAITLKKLDHLSFKGAKQIYVFDLFKNEKQKIIFPSKKCKSKLVNLHFDNDTFTDDEELESCFTRNREDLQQAFNQANQIIEQKNKA